MAGKPILLFIVAFKFIAPKVSFMEKWRKKGTEPSRNYSRVYLLFLAAGLGCYGILLLKTLLHKWRGKRFFETVLYSCTVGRCY